MNNSADWLMSHAAKDDLAIRERIDRQLEAARARARYARESRPVPRPRAGLTSREYRDRIDTLKDVPCSDCGGRFISAVMEFDHVPERGAKSFVISAGLSKAWELVLEEIKKCDVVCANCHRVRTVKRRFHLRSLDE
jgi:hypothetical protein